MQAGKLHDGARRRHKLRNILQSALLLVGMLGLLSLCVWIVFGPEGTLWALGGWLLALLLSPRISPRLLLRLYRAQRLHPRQFPAGFGILEELSRRAGLDFVPALYYVPSATLNAFTMGRGDDVVIAVTDGMLRTLGRREFAGVIAHELSHVRNNDLWVMSLADSISRLTNLMTLAGAILLIVNLPFLLTGQAQVSWLLVALLLLAPTIGNLLQMGLSRAREYDADLDAAALTGDPAGLASALMKLEHHHSRLWEQLLLPGRRIPDPSLLRSHPPTEERIERLMSLYPPARLAAPPGADDIAPPADLPWRRRQPRWRITGLWH